MHHYIIVYWKKETPGRKSAVGMFATTSDAMTYGDEYLRKYEWDITRLVLKETARELAKALD